MESLLDRDDALQPAARMHQLLSGFEVSQALFVVAELGVATALLDGPRNLDELAAAVGANADALGRLIRFLGPFGVFSGEGENVAITDLGRTLADGPADSVRSIARFFMATHYAPFGDLLHTARTGQVGATNFLGRPFFEWVGSSTELAQLQNKAMAEFTSAARTGALDAFQFPQRGVVADIGGADGTFLAEILSRTPGCRGIVFDLPNVVAAAPETLAAAGLSDRATVAAGDFFDHVPGADTYVLSCVLHDWSDADALRILRNIARAAPEQARLLLVELVLPDDDIPHLANFVDFTMLVMVGGRERTESEWRRLLAAGGFALDNVIPTGGLYSLLDARLNRSRSAR
ncbi:methyltransferase [Mycobacterium sp. 1165178.9]|uniref:methyltransferase n=1 Tax=Mycobacterium sp. 1165178.9 TaxID=1834070 RepID=UPI0007FCE033|nr:methyltransferase [Mycobacterium sp. 1165178.9]OBK87208.1 hypothetical protein A5652_13785 [Mycobacterium sp. 1165178.9]